MATKKPPIRIIGIDTEADVDNLPKFEDLFSDLKTETNGI